MDLPRDIRWRKTMRRKNEVEKKGQKDEKDLDVQTDTDRKAKRRPGEKVYKTERKKQVSGIAGKTIDHMRRVLGADR